MSAPVNSSAYCLNADPFICLWLNTYAARRDVRTPDDPWLYRWLTGQDCEAE